MGTNFPIRSESSPSFEKINNNIEVLSKILNSVAAKHDCRIDYDTETRKVNSHCDENDKALIIQEVMGILGAN